MRLHRSLPKYANAIRKWAIRTTEVVVAASLVTAAVSSGAAATAAQTGGTLQFDMASQPQTLDPARAGDNESIQFARMQFNTLVAYSPLGVNIVPSLAKRYRISDHGRTYTFTLRSGVKFSNGDPLTAQDVVFTFTRLNEAATAAPYQSSFEDIVGAAALFKGQTHVLSGIQAVGSQTVVMHLVQPESYWLNVVALPSAGIEDARIAADWNTLEAGPAARPITPVGTGPFILVPPGASPTAYTLVRNSGYWQPGLPRLAKIIVSIGATPHLAFQRFVRGETQFVSEVDPADYLLVKSPTLRHEYYDVHYSGLWYLGLNAHVHPWNNLFLRQAVEYAINKPFLDAVVNNGRAQVANSILPAGMPGYEATYDPYPVNDATATGRHAALQKARALVKKAGFPHGVNVGEFDLRDTSGALQVASIVKTELAAVGIRCTPRILSYPVFSQLASQPGRLGFYYVSWGQDYPDPQDFLYYLFDGQQAGSTNRDWYSNPVVNRLLATADSSLQQPLRLRLYDEAQHIILSQAALVPLTFDFNDGLIAPNAYPKNIDYWAAPFAGSPQYAYLWVTSK